MTEPGGGQTADADAAPAIALAAASRQKADAFLDEQTRLTRLAIERETREERLRNWSQFVEYASALMKLAFEFVVALMVVAIGTALAAAVWNAAHDNGLVIEAFSVPPDLANRGLTGEVVAGKVLDRLSALQEQTQSNRAASSYVNNWGNDIKVQIPETGVSIGQLYRYLAAWLGNETHISGEIYRDAVGLAVTARVGGQPGETLHGNDAALDVLIGRAAEAVYGSTQPYRYAVYLDNHGRSGEAQPIYRALLAGRSDEDRAWAYIGLASEYSGRGDYAGAAALLRRAIAVKPDVLLTYDDLANNEGQLQHDEASLLWLKKAVALQARGPDPSMNAADFAHAVAQNRNALAQSTGDYLTALGIERDAETLPDRAVAESARQSEVSLCGALHDRACVAAAVAAFEPTADPFVSLSRVGNRQQAAGFLGDWADVLADADFMVPTLRRLGGLGALFVTRIEYPAKGLALAARGRIGAARAAIAGSPLDCDVCLRARGRVDAFARNWGGADYWFARAAADAPSVPFAQAEWGMVLLARGDPGRAIAHFAQAHGTGPHFADPLEGWGEALIRLNRSDLALAKFAEAARYAPNWGRLHLRWGEALLWSGDADGARRQFAAAAGLDLAPADRATLARLRAAHG